MSCREVDDLEEILRMASALAEIGYRDLSQSANQQRLAVARRLWREGVTERLLRMLWSYAESCGRTPIRLFAWWLDTPSRAVAKVNEMREHSGWTKRVLDKVVASEKQRGEPAPVHRMDERRRQA